jgi:peptidoglycan-associated lipoprotein
MVALATALGACSGEPKTADDADVFRAANEEPAWELENPSEHVTITHVEATPPTVELSGFIARVCEIPEPKFPFDSSNIKNRTEPALDALGECMTEGPLAGENVKLVGHADRRGPEPYNMALGQRRAGSVAEYLEDHGVKKSRIITSSMGELDADGTTPEGMKEDRRVEVVIRQ